MSDKLQMVNEVDDSPWYKNGLAFSCTECGQCCTGAPGYVWVSDEEIETMAAHLNLEVNQFSMRYLRRINGKLALVEMSKTYDCVFLKERKCSIYQVRPKQCRTFPWWPQNLKSEQDWVEAANYCEGIRKDASVVPLSTIQTQLNIQINT